VRGRTAQAAQDLIAGAGLAARQLITPMCLHENDGTVVSQDPAPGAVAGTDVAIAVCASVPAGG
jgi:beta-lactam-binding protein with PASTA domain